MKTFKKITFGLLATLALLNLAILLTGKTYLYKGIANTYLKGKFGADIDEYLIFENREVKTGNYQPWPLGTDYNTKPIPVKYLSVLENLETIAFLLIKEDSIRIERYWDKYSENSFTNSFSMAKTIVSILTGIAIDEGKIKSVNQKVGDFIDQYKEGVKSKVTVKHLLTMSSGLDFDESYVSPFAFPAESYFGTDLEKVVLKYDVIEEPGKKFKYLSGNTQLLSFVLEKATGMKLSDYCSEKLWKPLGAKNHGFWSLDRKGGDEKAYCCFNSNAKDFARIGQLYLKNGNWKGRQIVSESYVKASIVPADLVENDDGSKLTRYGYSWWMTDYKNRHIFFAEGMMGQYIIVVPDKKIVLVRLARNRAKEKINRLPADLYMYLDLIDESY